jgi:hypothetical protein
LLAEISGTYREMDANLQRRIERSGGTVARLLAEEVSQGQVNVARSKRSLEHLKKPH